MGGVIPMKIDHSKISNKAWGHNIFHNWWWKIGTI